MTLIGLKRLFFNILFGVIFLFSYEAFANPVVSKIQLNNQRQQVEIVISNKSGFRSFILHKPNRLVIDIENASSSKLAALSDQINLIKSASVSNYDKNGQQYLRIILDLNQEVTVENAHFQKIRNQRFGKIIVQLDGNFSKKLYQQPNKVIIKQPTEETELTSETEMAKQLPDDNLDHLIFKLVDGDDLNQQDNSFAKNQTTQGAIDSQSASYVIKNPTIGKENNNQPIIKKRHIPIIVIDPGHGGKDPGTIGNYARSREKNITLAYARELKIALDKTKKYKVYLTRNSDVFISLGRRVEIARKVKADLFISLHANSAANKRVSGLSIYTLSENSSDKQAALLAEKENRSDIIAGLDFSDTSPDIMKTLINMSQRDSMNNSAIYANIAIKSMQNYDIEVLNNTHRFAGFRVLTAPDMASVLIELGYLSNKSEERKLNDFGYRRKIAASLLDSIDRYFISHAR